MIRIGLVMIGLIAMVGCQTAEYPAPILGSTYRIGDDVRDPKSELLLNVLTNHRECQVVAANPEELEACLPRADRGSAQVHLAFNFLDKVGERPFPIALKRDQLLLTHDKTRQDDFELIPHKPRSSGQLYIVIIDGSSSMYDNDGERIEKVNKALRSSEVVRAFYPSEDAKTGVVLMRFNNGLVGLDGGEPKILRDKAAYRKMVRDHLMTKSGGYTHLYKAVREGMTTLLKKPTLASFLSTRNAQPTLIVLTDGFNNEAASDTCATNTPRLKLTLDVVRKARSTGSTATPVLYTVGLGREYRSGDKPDGINARVTEGALCGAYTDNRIDGELEELGIDHVSLKWLAEAGGGGSFVRDEPKGLANVFLQAAAKRYEWFEVKYRIGDSLFHRKAFEIGLRLKQGYLSSTTVEIHPNPWMDAPTASAPEGEVWVERSALRRTLVLVMPILGIIAFLTFLNAALFNARRALFRRGRPRR